MPQIVTPRPQIHYNIDRPTVIKAVFPLTRGRVSGAPSGIIILNADVPPRRTAGVWSAPAVFYAPRL